MSAKFGVGRAQFVFLFVVVVCVSGSKAFAQTQGGGVDGGGDGSTFTRTKSNLPTVAVNIAAQPASSRVHNVSAEVLDRDTEAKLALMVSDNFQFDDTPFVDVKNQIRNDSNLNIVVDASATGDLQDDTAITFSIQGISLDKSLEMMLRKHNCDFIIDHGVVRIISLDVAEDPEFFMLRIYDCSRLIQAVPSLMDQPVPLPSSAGGEVTPETKLLKLFTDTVTPDEWALTGTGDGVINQVGNCLVVSQSRCSHRAVQNLISQLESKLIQK